MNMNQTPSSERVHIAFFGKRNAGKSSVMNAVTGQDLAVVSDVKGTTTDPVSKAMELLPLGPVVMIDTPGIDDAGELGALRVRKSYQTLNKTDAAVLVIDAGQGPSAEDLALIGRIRDKSIPFLIVFNKSDLPHDSAACRKALPADIDTANILFVSAACREGITELKERLAIIAAPQENQKRIIADKLQPGDLAVLVVPIDKAAPKGRLILPQQQTIRDILDADAISIVTKEDRLSETLTSLGKKPALVITDSQVFGQVAKQTPDDILLTSFSILFARYKGSLADTVRGAAALDHLQDGDTVLISEGCTHHRQCNDIGTVKLPGWISDYTGKKLQFAFTSGTEFPDDLSPYSLIVHCGGCMLNEREMLYRIKCAGDQNVPITNYGILISYIHGILKRSTAIFPEITALLP